MIDESAHKVFDYGMKDWHDFRTHKCSHCSRQLDIYYCESRLYLVRCKHCKIVSLVEAGNPNEAAEKVSRRAEPENKALTLEELLNAIRNISYGSPEFRNSNGCTDSFVVNLYKAILEEAVKEAFAYARKSEGSKKS